MRKILSVIISLGITFLGAQAQQVRPDDSYGIYHKLLRLNKLTHVLYFAAHPDDENTRLLAWLVNDQNLRTAYLSLTRGDGGQNILGKEQGAALGLIRTYELLEARKIDGAEQFFTRAVDFGFSKNFRETFNHWNADTLTSDAVWVLRNFRPDVIICRFPPDARAGHGQHAASAIIAARAFKESGDSRRYASQLKYCSPWRPKRILFNTFRFGNVNTTAGNQFQLKTGQYKPELGMGYGELAGISRSVHKSQGAGTPSVPGVQPEYFELVDGEPFSGSLFDGIDMTWNRVGRPDIGKMVDKIVAGFDYHHPSASIPALLKVKREVAEVHDDYWRKEKLQELDQIILDCAGLMAECYTDQPEAIAGSSHPFFTNIIARADVPVVVRSIRQSEKSENVTVHLKKDSLFSFKRIVTIPAGTERSEPYWMKQPGLNEAHYSYPSESVRGLPSAPPSLYCSIEITIGDEPFIVKVPLSYKRLDPVKGDVVEALRIVPAATISFNQPLLVASASGTFTAEIRIRSYRDLHNAAVVIHANDTQKTIALVNMKEGTDSVIIAPFSEKELNVRGDAPFLLGASLKEGEQEYNRSLHVISYNHIPTLQYFTPSEVKVLPLSWKCTAKRIGFIEGAGDYTAEFLRLAGLQVEVLQASDFASAAKLARYDAIVTGVRAVNTQPNMRFWLPVLHQYVRQGGTLLVQYNTLQDLATERIGPYPFSLSTLRVTEEDAPVGLLNPQHRLLTYPNKISDADFKGWVQERGLYFPSTWDSHYEPLFEMHDQGENPLQGSTLYAPYGKGHFIYTSLSFFRQFPAGNAGAIRLFMNMLSIGK